MSEEIETKPRIFLSLQEELEVVKSEHLVEVSKYHQTIQHLNAKLLILSKEHNVEELCSVYEKEIMVLELKVQELREQISSVCSDNKDQMKATIKSLN